MSTPWDNATKLLGGYYGIPSTGDQQQFLGRLQEANPGTVTSAVFEPTTDPELDSIIMELQGSASGPGVSLILKKLEDYLSNADKEKAKALIEEKIKITYEEAGIPSSLAASKAITRAHIPNDVGVESEDYQQGTQPMGRKGKTPTQGSPGEFEVVSIRQQLGDVATQQSETSSNINKTPTAPASATSPKLSVIQVFDCRMTPSSNLTGATQVFMNAIPTLEMSRCQPMLDISIITPHQPLNHDNRLVAMGITKDILGSIKIKDTTTPDFLISTAADVKILDSLFAYEQNASVGIDYKGDERGYSFSTAGMEMFLSPQTMTSATPYVEMSDSLSPMGASSNPATSTAGDDLPPGGGSRPVPIIDRFRPLAGINSFKIGVQSRDLQMKIMTGELSITCYDRSRLHLLTPLIKPGVYNDTQLLIKFGWSHPAGASGTNDPKMAIAKVAGHNVGADNLYATFLNGCNSEQMYIVSNSTYNFEKDGSVNINLSLVSSSAARALSMTLSDGNPAFQQATKAVDNIITAINRTRKYIMGTGDDVAKSIASKQWLNVAASTSAALATNVMANQELMKFLASKPQDTDVAKLRELLEQLFGKKTRTKIWNKKKATVVKKTVMAEAELNSYRNTVAELMAAKAGLLNGYDPFLKPIESEQKIIDPPISTTSHSPRYVSLGKILLTYLGSSMAGLGQYSEVQLIFYSLNAKASYVRNFNLAQYPIHLERFKFLLSKAGKGGLDIPVSRLMSILRTYFVSAAADFPYGFNSPYAFDKKKGSYSLNKKAQEDDTVVHNVKKRALADAYGTATPENENAKENLVFKQPQLQYKIETVQLRENKDDESENPEPRALVRVHIYDAQCNGQLAIEQILQAAMDSTMGVIGTAASQTKNDPSNHAEAFNNALSMAKDVGIIEGYKTSLDVQGQPTEVSNVPYQLKGNLAAVKRWVSYNMPSLIYGSNATAIIDAKLSTMNDGKMAALSMQDTGGHSLSKPMGNFGGGVPLQILPLKLSLSTMGCPLVSAGQRFFIDFGTGTTADGVYAVTSVNHSIQNGQFTTSLELLNVEAYGSWSTLAQTIQDAMFALSKLGEGETSQ